MAVIAAPLVAFAAPITKVVLESDVTQQEQGTPATKAWVAYTNPDSFASYAFQSGPGTPKEGTGSLELKNNLSKDEISVLNFSHEGAKLSGVAEVKYSTYRTAGNLDQVASMNVLIDANGPDVAGGDTTLVFQPVYNSEQGSVQTGQWEDWVGSGSGVWWSTNAINGQCAGEGAACDKTWAEIVANNPDAVIKGGVGVSQGKGNNGLTTAIDSFTFDQTKYNFELVAPKPTKPMSKDDCKDDRWKKYEQPAFKNQGDCVSSIASDGKAKGNPSIIDIFVSMIRNIFG